MYIKKGARGKQAGREEKRGVQVNSRSEKDSYDIHAEHTKARGGKKLCIQMPMVRRASKTESKRTTGRAHIQPFLRSDGKLFWHAHTEVFCKHLELPRVCTSRKMAIK
jgi:hypothetical protein